MSQSDFEYLYEAGKVQKIPQQIGVRADPNLDNVESFAVTHFFELENGERIEVAKADNSPHDEGDIHVDRYYREVGAEIKDFTVSFSNVWEAEDSLRDDVKRHAQQYLDNHGAKAREDGANG